MVDVTLWSGLRPLADNRAVVPSGVVTAKVMAPNSAGVIPSGSQAST